MNQRIGRDDICQSVCPACGFQIAAPFFNGGAQPLATLAWPASHEAARSMPRLPVDFVRCVECGHVYNPAFDYAQVPYSDKPNLMFNQRRAVVGISQRYNEPDAASASGAAGDS